MSRHVPRSFVWINLINLRHQASIFQASPNGRQPVRTILTTIPIDTVPDIISLDNSNLLIGSTKHQLFRQFPFMACF